MIPAVESAYQRSACWISPTFSWVAANGVILITPVSGPLPGPILLLLQVHDQIGSGRTLIIGVVVGGAGHLSLLNEGQCTGFLAVGAPNLNVLQASGGSVRSATFGPRPWCH